MVRRSFRRTAAGVAKYMTSTACIAFDTKCVSALERLSTLATVVVVVAAVVVVVAGEDDNKMPACNRSINGWGKGYVARAT